MSSNRDKTGRGAIHRPRRQIEHQALLERRRAEMHAAEGHAAAFPAATRSPSASRLGTGATSGIGCSATEPDQGCRADLSVCMVAGPIPSTSSSWLIEEAAMLVAELDDLLGGDRPDPLDLVELLGGGAAEADRAGLPARGRRGGARPGDDHLLTVAEAGAKLIASRLAPRPKPPARLTASVTLEPAGRR